MLLSDEDPMLDLMIQNPDGWFGQNIYRTLFYYLSLFLCLGLTILFYLCDFIAESFYT